MKSLNPALKIQFDKIHADGLNIYALMNKAKRILKAPKLHFPDQVLLKVCDSYWLHRREIKRPFPWFLRVLREEWLLYQARSHDEGDDTLARGSCAAIGEILVKMGYNANNPVSF